MKCNNVYYNVIKMVNLNVHFSVLYGYYFVKMVNLRVYSLCAAYYNVIKMVNLKVYFSLCCVVIIMSLRW